MDRPDHENSLLFWATYQGRGGRSPSQWCDDAIVIHNGGRGVALRRRHSVCCWRKIELQRTPAVKMPSCVAGEPMASIGPTRSYRDWHEINGGKDHDHARNAQRRLEDH